MRFSILLNIQELFDLLPVYGHHDYDVTSHLITMAGWSSALGVIIAVVLVLVSLLLNKYGKARQMNVSSKALTTAFVLVWLAGFVIYDVGMYIGHNRLSLITNMPMAIVHAFEMFLMDSDVAAIHEPFHNNWIFMGCFSVVHLLAAFITLIFVIKHFGYYIVAGMKMLCETYFFKSKKQTFVFWGLNDASCLLARSIKDKLGRDGDYRIIIVRTGNDDENSSVKNGMDRLFNFLSLKNNDLEKLLELDCLTTSTYVDLAHLSGDVLGQHELTDILRKRINLRQLSKILTKKTSEKIHLFFLNDDSQVNIQAVGNLKKDLTINQIADKGKSVFFYCQARYNSVHRVIEDEQQHANIVVKVVDPSHISVEILKQTAELQPVRFVDIEHDATVSSAFNALIVGFDEVGHDAMRFLYEFGAFVKSGSDSGNVERSCFHCDVVDKNIKEKAGLFAVNAPAISQQMSYNADDIQALSPITLRELDVLSIDFYNYLEKKIESLNYIVIAMDNDEQNVSLAVRIFRLAVRYRKDLTHFAILVRVNSDNDGHLLRITEHYNRLWASELMSFSTPGHLHQKTVRKDEKIHTPITMFGSLSAIYTYDFIVSDSLKQAAKDFKYKYDLSVNNKKAPSLTDEWENEYRELMQLADDYIEYSPTFSAILRLRRVQRQNMENCYHQFTKQELALIALGDENYNLLSSGCLSREKNTTTYRWQKDGNIGDVDDSILRVLEVLAQTEHLRWVASHEILGYCNCGTLNFKDEARLQHGCLKPWNELTEEIRSYDYNVVDVSLGID